jgi:hypothetical protein
MTGFSFVVSSIIILPLLSREARARSVRWAMSDEDEEGGGRGSGEAGRAGRGVLLILGGSPNDIIIRTGS